MPRFRCLIYSRTLQYQTPQHLYQFKLALSLPVRLNLFYGTRGVTMEPIYEIIKIKQVMIEVQNELKERLLNPAEVVQVAHYFIGEDDREIFLVMCLNAHHQVIAVYRCHVGSLTSSIVSTREVFKACILNNACSIILAHNHPSGNLQPSKEDIKITKQLMKAGHILDIPLLDHLIINGRGEFLSFQKESYLLGKGGNNKSLL